MVAKRFREYDNDDSFLIFASGVSNSKNKDAAAYRREYDLLETSLEQHKEKTLVYFSTTSVNDPAENTSAYVAHKLKIEAFIRSAAKNHIIFRVSNLAGQSANNNTVLNFFLHNIKNGIHFHLWQHACRNVIGLDDFYQIADAVLCSNAFLNKTVNIANPENYAVTEIVKAIEKFLNRTANYDALDRGGCFDIDITDIVPAIGQLGINFGPEYLQNLLHKYYSVNEL